jgi:zinc transporter 1
LRSENNLEEFAVDYPERISTNVILAAELLRIQVNQDLNSSDLERQNDAIYESDHSHTDHKKDLNLHGVFLHILGDFLGSVGVVVSTICVLSFDNKWTIYIDPLMSLFITAIIVYSSLPLVKSASYILLQGAPESICVDALKRDILTIPRVLDVHELHVWQLSDTQSIASVHIRISTALLASNEYMELAVQIKKKLHVKYN